MPDIGLFANWASIITAGIAVWAWARYLLDRRSKRDRREKYLKSELDAGKNAGMRSVMHLMAALGMTKAEILDAAFRSKVIARRTRPDFLGVAETLLLVYDRTGRGDSIDVD